MDARAAAQDMQAGFNEAMVAMQEGLTSFGKAISAACQDGMAYTRRTTRTSYHLLGKYTLPIEDEIYASDPDYTPPVPFKDYENKIGLGILFLPVVVPTVISSLTWIPLIGNSIPSAVKGFAHVVNMPRLDCTNRTVSYPTLLGVNTGNDHRGIMRNIYGSPGYLLGAAVALPIAATIALGRLISNSAKSFAHIWTLMVNAATSNEVDELGNPIWKIDYTDERHPAKRVIGGLGYVLGAAIGGVSALVILATRGIFNLFYHSARSFVRAFAYPWNFATSFQRNEVDADANAIETMPDDRHWMKRFVFGGIGGIVGFALGGIAAITVFAARGLFNLFYHSGISFGRAFAQFWNFSTSFQRNPQEAETNHIALNDDNRHWVKRFGFGGIGLVLGVTMGAITSVAVFAARGIFNLFYHSGISLGRAFAQFWNFSTSFQRDTQAAADYAIVLENDQRHWIKRFGFGGIGMLLGVAAGAVTAVAVFATRGIFNLFYHSGISFGRAFAHCWNFATSFQRNPEDATNNEISLNEDQRHPVKRFVFGGVGGILGCAVGGITAAVVFATRGVFNLFYHSAISFGRVFARLWNLAASDAKNDDGQFKYHVNVAHDDNRHWVKKFIFGGLGYLPGLIIGGITAGLCLASRGLFNLFYHSAISFGRAFAHLWNFATEFQRDAAHQHNQSIALENYDRSFAKTYLVGGIGGMLGIVAGSIAAAAVFVTRGIFNLIYHSARSLGRMVEMMSKFAWNVGSDTADKDAILSSMVNDPRHPVKRFGFGGIGYVLGAPIGAIAAVAAFAARFVLNFIVDSAKSFGRSFAPLWNFATSFQRKDVDKDNQKIELATDQRHFVYKYIFGGVGYVLGAAVGGVAAVAVFAARGIWNLLWHSARSFGRMFQLLTHFAWDIDFETTKNDLDGFARYVTHDDRHPVKRFGFGAVGYALGAAVGSVVGIALLTLRTIGKVIGHSISSFLQLTGSIALFAAHVFSDRASIVSLGKNFIDDDRHPARTYGFGLIGCIAGAVFGTVAAAVIFAWRVFTNIASNSFDSMVRMAMLGFSFAATIGGSHQDLKKTAEIVTSDDRHPVQRFGFGALGYIVGAAMGTAIAALTFAIRGIFNFIYHSARSFGRTFATIWNFAMPDTTAGTGKFHLDPEQRSLVKKLVFGGVGYLLGAIAGSIAALVIWAVRGAVTGVKNTMMSFTALSGSLLNAAGNRLWFEGIGGDDRPTTDKVIGALGYVASAVIVGPIAALIFLSKKAVEVLFLIAAIALSPLTLACKTIGLASTSFKTTVDTDPVIEQRFRNLFSTLNATGRFTPGSEIAVNKDGGENVGLFFFKGMKLNINSTTENVLRTLLKAYYASQHKTNFFDSAEFTAAIDSVKARYTEGMLTTVEEMEDQHTRIDNLATFVKSYLAQAACTHVPQDLETAGVPVRKTWGENFRHTFWGGKQQVASVQQSPVSTPENQRLMV